MILPATSLLRGVLLVAAATALYAVMNTGAKVLSADLPTVEIVWARTLGHLLVMIAVFAPSRGGWRLLLTHRPGTQLARSLLLVVSTSFFFTALAHVPLADATAVSFTSPFIVAALAGPLLAERVTRDRWVSIGLGFLGALIVIRPTGQGANAYAFLVLGSAVGYALYQLFTRRVAGIDAPETTATYSALVGALVLSAIVPFFWTRPPTAGHWAILGALGLSGALGHYCVARALTWAPASVVSPIHYVQLVWAAMAGYLVFGHVPAVWTWVGAAVIVVTGLRIAWRERRTG